MWQLIVKKSLMNQEIQSLKKFNGFFEAPLFHKGASIQSLCGLVACLLAWGETIFMLISNMFIHCKVKGKNFFTRKATSSKLQQLTEQGVLCSELT